LVTVRALALTTSEAAELVTEPLLQLPEPPVEATVTVKLVVPEGVDADVVMVSVDVSDVFEIVVGLKAAVAPVGAVQLMVTGGEVQVPEKPPHVVVMV
jgi:hypothetical protein